MGQSPREFEGDDLEGALGAAAAALGAPAESLDFEVLEEGRRGIFGLGARRVRIVVECPPPAAARSATEAPDVPRGESEGPAALQETLERLLRLMGLDLKVRTSLRGDRCRVELTGPDRRALLQRDGELISALQFLLNRMGRRAWPDAGHIHLDCDGYNNTREDSVVELAREVASLVARTGESKRLHPMNPFERRLVHLTVREFPGLTTRSDGDGFLKQITVLGAGKDRYPGDG